MGPDDYLAGPRALLEIQAKCREWREILCRNGWESDKAGAARAPEAKAAELAVMGLIRKHRALLEDCERTFGRDPSTALRRAFDYIDIYLSRGPEALEGTVGLAECLTVEVAQPNVAEPYREPTFVVQLGRWAQRLAELAEADRDGARKDRKPSRGLPTGCTSMGHEDASQEAMPPLADVRFFQQVAADIKARAEFYRDAGEWLDENFSNDAFQRRERARWKELLGKEKSGELSPAGKRFLENQRAKPKAQTERARKSFLALRRFNEATGTYRKRPPAFPTVQEAKRILLMTWLMTDPEAEHAGLRLTEFESWAWDTDRDEHEIQSRRYASDWWRYPSDAYDAWVDLARRAWATTEPMREPAPNVKHGDAGGGGAAGDGGAEGPQARALEAVAAYVERMLECAEWIGQELELSLTPSFQPSAVLGEGYCKTLRWLLRPVAQVPGAVDLDALAGYGVAPATLLSGLSRAVLGEDFPRAVRWLWSLLDGLPAGLWRGKERPGGQLVRDWKKATRLLRRCHRVAGPAGAEIQAGNDGAARDRQRNVEEWVANLAGAVHRLIVEHDAMSRFRAMVKEREGLKKATKRAEWRWVKRHQEALEAIKTDPRLRDKAAGPPKKGWVWYTQPYTDPATFRPGVRPVTTLTGWMPPGHAKFAFDAANEFEPAGDLPIAFKYTRLAAIHDYVLRGVEQVYPPEWRNRRAGTYYYALMQATSALGKDWRPAWEKAMLEAFLADVTEDLRHWRKVPNGRGPQLPDDAITLAVAVERYRVSRTTLRRWIREGLIKSYRPTGAARNTLHVVSEAEVASRCTRKS